MDDPRDALRQAAPLLALTALVSSAGGIGLMIRHNKTIKRKDIIAAFLTSVSACTIVFLLLYSHLADSNPTLLYGVSGLSGVGGASTLDLLLLGLRSWAKRRVDADKKE